MTPGCRVVCCLAGVATLALVNGRTAGAQSVSGVIESELGFGAGLGSHPTGHARMRGDVGARWDLGCGRSLGGTIAWMVLLGTLQEGSGESGLLIGPRGWWIVRRLEVDAQVAYLRMNGLDADAGHGLALAVGLTSPRSAAALKIHVDLVYYPASYGTRSGMQADAWVSLATRQKLGWIVPALLLVGGIAYANADHSN